MLSIDDQQRTVGVPQYRAAGWSDEFAQMVVVLGADNRQPDRPAVVNQVLEKAVLYRHRLHPQIRMTSLPTGQPAIQVGECPASAFGIRRPVNARHGSPADDRPETSLA